MIASLEYFKAFYYTARYGSVTGAAAELSLSQPAVSQSIRQLERSLGVELFYRAARGVQLTAEGQVLYSYVEKGYEQIEQGVEKVRQMQNLELGEVRIGASDMTLQFYLLPFLEKFHYLFWRKIPCFICSITQRTQLYHIFDKIFLYGRWKKEGREE